MSYFSFVRIGVVRLEQQRAKRRRQRQRDQRRQGHRHGDGQSELFIENTSGAAEEGDRDEHRGQHEGDADDRRGNVLHGPDGRLARIDSIRLHMMLDRLHHDDGVVDHEADGQHHGEQGQRVDGKPEHDESAERADQRHRHRQHRNQRRPPALQEDIHNDEHQHQRFKEGFGHFLQRGADEAGIVDDGIDLEIWRERLPGLFDDYVAVPHRVESIGVRHQLHGKADRRLSVQITGNDAILVAHFDPGHIVHPDE